MCVLKRDISYGVFVSINVDISLHAYTLSELFLGG